MKKNPIIKNCIVCHLPFSPDPRVGQRQKVCKKFKCQQERKKLAQQLWLAKNPGYFKGRYPQLKEQILQNQKKKYLCKNSGAILKKPYIQDELTVNNNNLISFLEKLLTIQDELTLKLKRTKRQTINTMRLLYKTS